MKKNILLFLFMMLLASSTIFAQKKVPVNDEESHDITIIKASQEIFNGSVQNHIKVTDLDLEKYDRVTVLNRQGIILINKVVNTSSTKMDVSHFDEGVYLLGLRSSSTRKEKIIKFMIRR